MATKKPLKFELYLYDAVALTVNRTVSIDDIKCPVCRTILTLPKDLYQDGDISGIKVQCHCKAWIYAEPNLAIVWQASEIDVSSGVDHE